MKRLKNNIILAGVLLGASVLTFLVQIYLFHNTEETYFLLLQELAFIPIHVLIVTLVLDELLSSREKQQKKKKINVIISTFFVEAGSSLIHHMSGFFANADQLGKKITRFDWSKKEMAAIKKEIGKFPLESCCREEKLTELRAFLQKEKQFLLTLMENTQLLEHDTFTDMLWAVFHVTDELESRRELVNLPPKDVAHLMLDIQRAYIQLVPEWLEYMKYLKKDYPYLFSLAVRKNPFIKDPDVRILE